MFAVHVGFTATGRNRWRRFSTLAAATAFVNRVFATTGTVLTIVTDTLLRG
jgi:hypothetical protein